MRTDTPRYTSNIVTSPLTLLLFGTVMLLAGFFYPGKQATAATTFIVAGAGMVAVGILLPRMRELEVGVGGFKTKVVNSQPTSPPPQPLLDIQADKLTRFARLVSGDTAHARELVEEAFARSRRRHRRIPPAERDAFIIRTLIELLDTADERRWLRGSPPHDCIRPEEDLPELGDTIDSAVVHALQTLPFVRRVAFLLRADWLLKSDEIAMILERPGVDVDNEIALARDVLRPYINVEGATRYDQ